MSPRHVIMATGVSGIPNLPKIDSLSAFQGPAVHSSQYHDGEDWSGKHAIVLGCGNSGHDISQDLYSSGAKVTMIQRSPSLVVNIEPSAQFPYKLYDEDRGTDECDFITTSMPTPLVKQAHRHFTKAARKTDKALLDGLKMLGSSWILVMMIPAGSLNILPVVAVIISMLAVLTCLPRAKLILCNSTRLTNSPIMAW